MGAGRVYDPALDGFPYERLDAAMRYLYALKPAWSRFGASLKVVPVFKPPVGDDPYGYKMGVDETYRLFVDHKFAANAPLHELSGAFEHCLHHLIRDTWRRMSEVDVDTWERYAPIAFDFEIASSIEGENEHLTFQDAEIACSRSQVFSRAEMTRWGITELPGLGDTGWHPEMFGLPAGQAAEWYLKAILDELQQEAPEEEEVESSEGEDSGESGNSDGQTNEDGEPELGQASPDGQEGEAGQEGTAGDNPEGSKEGEAQKSQESANDQAASEQSSPQGGALDGDQEDSAQGGAGDPAAAQNDQSEQDGAKEGGQDATAETGAEGTEEDQDQQDGEHPQGESRAESPSEDHPRDGEPQEGQGQGKPDQDIQGDAQEGDASSGEDHQDASQDEPSTEAGDTEGDGKTSNDPIGAPEPGQDSPAAGMSTSGSPAQQGPPNGSQGPQRVDANQDGRPNQLQSAIDAARNDPELAPWTNDIDAPGESSDWKEDYEEDYEGLSDSEKNQAQERLLEDISVAQKESGGDPSHVNSAMANWANKERQLRGISWEQTFARLFASHVSSARVAGMSDLTYTVRNPNQQPIGIILQGMDSYSPSIYALLDVSGSMVFGTVGQRPIDLGLDALKEAVRKVNSRFGATTTWFSGATKIDSWGTVSSLTDSYVKRKVSFSAAGTQLGSEIVALMLGKFSFRNKRFAQPDLLVVITDGLFEWPATRPTKKCKLLVLSTEPVEGHTCYPSWLTSREVVYIDALGVTP